MKRPLQAILPPLLIAIMIFILSSIPALKGPDLGLTFQDKVYHFIEYAVFGWFLTRASYRLISRRPAAPVLAVLTGFLYAITDEWHQSMVPGREGNLDDVLADGAGLVFAAVLFSAWVIKRNNR